MIVRRRTDPFAGVSPDGTPVVERARALLAQMRDAGLEARLVDGVLTLADVSSGDRPLPGRRKLPWPRRIAFDVLNAGLDDDPALLDHE